MPLHNLFIKNFLKPYMTLKDSCTKVNPTEATLGLAPNLMEQIWKTTPKANLLNLDFSSTTYFIRSISYHKSKLYQFRRQSTPAKVFSFSVGIGRQWSLNQLGALCRTFPLISPSFPRRQKSRNSCSSIEEISTSPFGRILLCRRRPILARRPESKEPTSNSVRHHQNAA